MWFDRGLILVVLAVLPAAQAGAEPAKTGSKRRGYDFTRPNPGEILPNPSESAGQPPQMRAYATVKAMATESGPAKTTKATAAPQPANGGTPAATQGPRPQTPSVGAAPPAAPSGGASASGSASAPLSTSLITQHVQKTLAGELAAKGLGSRITYHPSPLAETDPDIRAAEERAWGGTVASLAASWKAWQLAHPAAAPQRHEPAPEPAAPRAPGVVLLEGAPASVTGDLDDIDP